MRNLFFFLFLSLLSLLPLATAELPKAPTWKTVDPSPGTRRHDMCQRSAEVASGTRSLANGLAGMDISVLFVKNSWVAIDSKSNNVTGGLGALLMNRLAEMANFNWNFAIDSGPNTTAGETRDAWLVKRMAQYDVIGEWFTQTSARQSLGVVYLQSLLDMSAVLITLRLPASNPSLANTLFSFFNPFSVDLWLILVLAMVCSGVIYWILEKDDNKEDLGKGKVASTLMRATDLSISHFVQAGGFSPQTGPGRMFRLSWAFLIAIIFSSYTANLASFLISASQASNQINSLDDINRHYYPLCFRANSIVLDFLKPLLAVQYKNIKIVQAPTTNDALIQMQLGNCVAVATSQFEFDQAAVNETVNPSETCNVQQLFPSLVTAQGSMVIGLNSSICSGFPQQVFALHFQQMIISGEYTKFYTSYISSLKNNQCDTTGDGTVTSSSSSSSSSSSNSGSLNISDLGGTFILHLGVSVVSLVWSILRRYQYGGRQNILKKKEKKTMEKRDKMKMNGGNSSNDYDDGRETVNINNEMFLAASAQSERVDLKLTTITTCLHDLMIKMNHMQHQIDSIQRQQQQGGRGGERLEELPIEEWKGKDASPSQNGQQQNGGYHSNGDDLQGMFETRMRWENGNGRMEPSLDNSAIC